MNDSLQSKMSGTDRPVLSSALVYTGILLLGIAVIEGLNFLFTGTIGDPVQSGFLMFSALYFTALRLFVDGSPILALLQVAAMCLSVLCIALLPFITGWFAARGAIRREVRVQVESNDQSSANAGLCAAAFGTALASLVLLIVSYLNGTILETYLFVILSLLAGVLLGALGGYVYYQTYHRKQAHPPHTPPAMPAAA